MVGSDRAFFTRESCCSVWLGIGADGSVVTPEQGEKLFRLVRRNGQCGPVKFFFCRFKRRIKLLIVKLSAGRL